MEKSNKPNLIPGIETTVNAVVCPEHGPYEAHTLRFGDAQIVGACPICMELDARSAVVKQEADRKAATVATVVQSAEIPRRFASRTLDNYQVSNPGQQYALAECKDYAVKFAEALQTGRSLLLCGTPGTGKTHLAVGIAHEIMKQGHSAIFTTAMDAIRNIRDTYRKDSPISEREAIKRFAIPDLVIIDEVGNQYGTDAEKITLFDLINVRYCQSRPMILISNLRPTVVEQFLGERAFDRLRENGGKAIGFTWSSHRKAS